MRRLLFGLAVLGAVAALAPGCGPTVGGAGGGAGTGGGGAASGGGTAAGGGSAAGGGTGAGGGSAAGGGTGTGGGTAAGGGSGSGCTTLTVKNVLDWCTVQIGQGAASADEVLTACVAPGTIALSASPLDASFILGPAPWHGTAGDTGAGDPGTRPGDGTARTTVVVGSTPVCVWVCCPFPTGSGCPAPSSSQCP
jgi:hypothetical protein